MSLVKTSFSPDGACLFLGGVSLSAGEGSWIPGKASLAVGSACLLVSNRRSSFGRAPRFVDSASLPEGEASLPKDRASLLERKLSLRDVEATRFEDSERRFVGEASLPEDKACLAFVRATVAFVFAQFVEVRAAFGRIEAGPTRVQAHFSIVQALRPRFSFDATIVFVVGGPHLARVRPEEALALIVRSSEGVPRAARAGVASAGTSGDWARSSASA
jgi:hypothetical protein